MELSQSDTKLLLYVWNKLTTNNEASDLTELSRMKAKSTIIEYFLKFY